MIAGAGKVWVEPCCCSERNSGEQRVLAGSTRNAPSGFPLTGLEGKHHPGCWGQRGP